MDKMEQFLDRLAEMAGQKAAAYAAQKTVSVTRTGYGHGPGLFSQPMDPNVINATQLPVMGLDSKLPEFKTDLENPLYGIITGQTIGSGSTPADACAPWGVAGLTKLCRQMATLGTVGVSSDPISLERLGRYTDRADFRDYRLIGDPFSNTYEGRTPEPIPGKGGPNDFLNYELAKVVREMELEGIRRFAADIYTANPVTAPDAFHRAWYRGIDLLVNTGYQDAITGVACPKADSKIYNFATISTGGNNITNTAGAGSTLVDLVAEMVHVLKREAFEEGLDPVEWVFFGSQQLFREMTAVWPCSYLTNRCLVASASNPNMVEATEQVRMREEMRSGSFLWVDGQQVPFVIDNTIAETQGAGANAGTFTSTLYYLPLTVRGNFPVLFKTYFDFNGPGAANEAIRSLGALSYGMSVSPNGKWLFNLEKTGTCFQVTATTRPGLVLRTPFLAARITNIAYRPRVVANSWNPSAPSFYVNGGGTTGSGPSYYNPTTNG